MSTTSTTRISLDVIDVEKPCPVSWDTMRGDERIRFCGECSLHVYNLSAMSRTDAESLVNEREGGRGGRMCVRFFRRADGTVITQDCGGGVRAAARRATRWAAAAAGAVLCAVLSPIGLKGFIESESKGPTVNTSTVGGTNWLFPPPAPVVVVGKMPMPVMGDFACPPPATQPAPQPAPREFRGEMAAVPATQPTTRPTSE